LEAESTSSGDSALNKIQRRTELNENKQLPFSRTFFVTSTNCLSGNAFTRLPVQKKQDDQIGRIFTSWAIVCFGQCSGSLRKSPKLWLLISTEKDYISFYKVKWAGLHFGKYF
jgi:hypothetical protein